MTGHGTFRSVIRGNAHLFVLNANNVHAHGFDSTFAYNPYNRAPVG